MADAYLVTYKALITEADIKGGYANKNGTINFAGLDKKAENVAAAAGQNVTAAEFKLQPWILMQKDGQAGHDQISRHANRHIDA